MPLLSLSPSVDLVLSNDAFGINAPSVRLLKSDNKPRHVNGSPDLRAYHVFEYGFELGYYELEWMLGVVTLHSLAGNRDIFQFNGIDLCLASYNHVDQPGYHHFRMPFDGLVFWRSNHVANDEAPPGDDMDPVHTAYYMSAQVYQELYEYWPYITLLYSVFEVCHGMLVHETLPRFTWANYAVQFVGRKTPVPYIMVEDLLREQTIKLSPRLAQQVIRAGNLTDGTVLRLTDELDNKLGISIGVFADDEPRNDTLVVPPREFANVRALVNVLSIAF